MTEDTEKRELLFENSFLMTQERYLQLCKNLKAPSAVKRLRKWKIKQSICIGISLCIAISGVILKEFSLAAIGVAFTLAFLYKRFFQLKINNKHLYSVIRKSQMPEEWHRNTRFYDSGIEIEDVNKISKISYEQISGIADDGNELIVFLGEDTAMRLMHSEFTHGSYEDFAAFIRQKLAENKNAKALT